MHRPLGFLRSGRDAARKKLTVLELLIYDPALYDVVTLGTPVWNGLMSTPMRTYITINKSKFNRVTFFCTQGGNENKKLFSDMQALCGRPPVSVLALRAAVVKNEEYTEKLWQFAGALHMQSDATVATMSEDRWLRESRAWPPLSVYSTAWRIKSRNRSGRTERYGGCSNDRTHSRSVHNAQPPSISLSVS